MTGQNTELTFEIRDEFNRKVIAERIIRLLESGIPVSPIVIDGDWGSGKTEFCHKLINLLEQQNQAGEKPPVRAVFVDAFKADHADNPLMTLITAVLSVLPEDERAPIKEKVMPMLRFGLKTAGKAAISWALRQELTKMADDFESDLKKAGDSLVDVAVKSMIEEHEKASESLKALQEGLAMLAETGPVVVFIDELDRCRPDFAVSMLEVIKHTFDVEGVKFVLVTNMKQLEAAVSHRYGAVDAGKYLGKFVGFRFALPSCLDIPTHREGFDVSMRHFNNLIKRSSYLQNSCFRGDRYKDFMTKFVQKNNLSLRDIEKLVRNFEIYQSMVDENFNANLVYGAHIQMIFGVLLSTFFPDMAASILKATIDYDRLKSILGVELIDFHSNSRVSDELILFKVISIQARHPNQREGDSLSEDDKLAIRQFESWYASAIHAPDVFERTTPLMETLRAMGLGA